MSSLPLRENRRYSRGIRIAMISRLNVIAAIVGGWLAICLQLSIAPRMAIFGAYPDFPLIVLLAFCPALSRVQSAIFGFFLAVGLGGAVGANLWQWVISYSISGFVLAGINDNRVTPNVPVVFATSVFGTILSRLLFMFVAAPPGIASFLGATILTALYNGVLILPLYALLKRFLDPAFR